MKKTLGITGIALTMIVVATVLLIAFYSALSSLGVMYDGVSITEWTVRCIRQHPVVYAIEFACGVAMSFIGAESLYRDWEENK